MRWRPLTWFLLSLLFFVGAGFFWRLGEKWRTAKQGRAPSVATNQIPLTPQPKPTAQNAERQSVERQSVERGNAAIASHESRLTNHASVITNHFPYRLTNSPASLGQLARNPNAILLENALFDTAQPLAPGIPPHLRAQG